jgi:hypothetical protein
MAKDYVTSLDWSDFGNVELKDTKAHNLGPDGGLQDRLLTGTGASGLGTGKPSDAALAERAVPRVLGFDQRPARATSNQPLQFPSP